MTYTNAMINNKAAQSRGESAFKKEALRQEVFEKTGWMPIKGLSMKAIKQAAGF